MNLSINPFDPVENNKQRLYDIGDQLITEFLKINNIEKPIISINNNLRGRGIFYIKSKNIKINLKKCVLATKTPQYSWSFPGYKSDNTPIGVLAHEVGHYIFEIKKNKEITTKLNEIINSNEKSITSYDKNNTIHEAFAEMFKLFITNPDLLKKGRPLRYNFLINVMGLKPVINSNYIDAFKYANERYIVASQNWIK